MAGVLMILFGFLRLGVITSYSIHYTKLYEYATVERKADTMTISFNGHTLVLDFYNAEVSSN